VDKMEEIPKDINQYNNNQILDFQNTASFILQINYQNLHLLATLSVTLDKVERNQKYIISEK
jgi:hypothetical protein